MRFSVSGVRGERSWNAGASTPMVLASAQKVLVLRALTRIVAIDQRVLEGGVHVRELNRFYRAGTDAGAHERSLLADGLALESLDAWVPVTRLALYMMRYSSNAASDALSTLLEAPLQEVRAGAPFSETLRLPPLIVDQLALTDADPNAGLYRASTRSLVDALLDMEVTRPAAAPFDPFAYLPKLHGFGDSAVRGKKGRVPGHRAGAITAQSRDGVALFAAYAFTTPAKDASLEEAIEQALISMALSGASAESLVHA